MINKYWDMTPSHFTVSKEDALKSYEFYKQIGLKDEQSVLLSLFPIQDSYTKGRNIQLKLLDLYAKSDKTLAFSEFCLKNLEQIFQEIEDFMGPQKNNTPTLAMLAQAIQTAPVLPTQPAPTTSPTSTNSQVENEKNSNTKSKSLMSFFKKQKNNSRSVQYSFSPRHSQKSFFSMAPNKQYSVQYSYDDDFYKQDEALPMQSSFQKPANIPYADTESYHQIEEHGFRNVSTEPLSTFRTTCNTASIGTLLNKLQKGQAVKPDSIRLEELMNFFSYNIPDTNDMINIRIEMADKPNSKNKLLFIGLKGQTVKVEKQNVVILLDVSGSMYANATIMLKTIMTIVSKLNIGDNFSLVTYSDVDHTVIDSMVFTGDIEAIIEKLFSVEIRGCTNGSAGIETAYKIAEKNCIAGGANRVILMTDGDLNFGINSNDGLKNLILEKKKNNVFLSVIGMGCNNYKDDKLEILAKNGNGNYCVINEEFGIKENIINRYEQFMVTIAKDVKAQVEFNPSKVKSYRLLGYENRELAHSDFSNDGVIAEPFGSGSTCVALYEIEPANEKKFASMLKYQKSTLTESDEYCTVSVRYKLPLEETSQVIAKSINNCGDFSENLKLAFICYAIGEMYRQSKFDNLKDKLMAKYLAETFESSEKELALLNGQKIELLKFLMN